MTPTGIDGFVIDDFRSRAAFETAIIADADPTSLAQLLRSHQDGDGPPQGAAHCFSFGASSVLLAHALLNIFFGKIGRFVENFITDAHLVHVAQEGRSADVFSAAGIESQRFCDSCGVH